MLAVQNTSIIRGGGILRILPSMVVRASTTASSPGSAGCGSRPRNCDRPDPPILPDTWLRPNEKTSAALASNSIARTQWHGGSVLQVQEDGELADLARPAPGPGWWRGGTSDRKVLDRSRQNWCRLSMYGSEPLVEQVHLGPGQQAVEIGQAASLLM